MEFWTAQWEKHSSCSKKSVEDYFQFTLDLAAQVQQPLRDVAQLALSMNLFLF